MFQIQPDAVHSGETGQLEQSEIRHADRHTPGRLFLLEFRYDMTFAHSMSPVVLCCFVGTPHCRGCRYLRAGSDANRLRNGNPIVSFYGFNHYEILGL